VRPGARDLEPGETIELRTQLTRPPAGAEGVRLTFASGPVAATTPVQAQPPAEPEPAADAEPPTEQTH
jgi:hypothetical protein